MRPSLQKIFSLFICLSLLAGCTSINKPSATAAASAQPTPSEDIVSLIMPSYTVVNHWDSGSQHDTQYVFTIASQEDQDIIGWTMHLSAGGQKLEQNWNCTAVEKEGTWDIMPLAYNQNIAANSSVTEIGIIASSTSSEQLQIASLDVTLADHSALTIQPAAPLIAIEPIPTPAASSAASSPAAIQAAGALHVEGTHLVKADGQIIQLKGVSTHGIAWYPQYVNEDAFRTLRDTWGVNVIRLAMYTMESGGYCSGGDQAELRQLIDQGVTAAADLGMYVIIDWHILSDGDPRQNQSEAEAFFDQMSKKYALYDNVLYEICNEPQNSPWSSVIKPYAEDIIPIIRANDADAVILIGTNTWSQDVDEVINDPLEYDNVMYTLHFYAGTHQDDLRRRLTAALQAGIPVFVSECSICDASGSGGIDYASAEKWLDLLNRGQVSFIAWSLSNKAETSALIDSACTKTSGWTEEDLSETGKWFMQAVRS